MGHMGKDCRSKNDTGKPNGQRNQQKSGYKKFNGSGKFSSMCNHCGKTGHTEADCWALHGKNGKKGESANVAKNSKSKKNQGEIAFATMDIKEPEQYSFSPVNTTIDDEGYLVPDSFFDTFGGAPEPKEEDTAEEAGYHVSPEWLKEEALGPWETPTLCEDWIKVEPKRVAPRVQDLHLAKKAGKMESRHESKLKVGLRVRGTKQAKFSISLTTSVETVNTNKQIQDDGQRRQGNGVQGAARRAASQVHGDAHPL
jgi:hypothetical protein